MRVRVLFLVLFVAIVRGQRVNCILGLSVCLYVGKFRIVTRTHARTHILYYFLFSR